MDFTQQAHIKNASNWMAAAGHAIKEVVSLHQCECGEKYEQWGSRPPSPCPICEKTRPRKKIPDEKETERTERAGKRTKYVESKDKGKTLEITLPHHTKETRQSQAPYVFLDPSPGSRMGIPEAGPTTPFQAPILRDDAGTRYDERNVNCSPPPYEILPGTAEHREHVLSQRHNSMPRGHRRSESNALFNEEVHNYTRQNSGLREGTTRTGDSLYACPPYSTNSQFHSTQGRGPGGCS